MQQTDDKQINMTKEDVENDRIFLSPQFAKLHENILITGNKLPHWHQTSTVLVSTFRLADSVPSVATEEYYKTKQNWERQYPLPWDAAVKEAFLQATAIWLEKWLNKGHGACVLAEQDTRKIVEDTLHYEDGKKVVIYAFVIMPNHVHLLYALIAPALTPERFIGGVKRFTARLINQHLHSTGTIWQKRSFDRLVRDADSFARYLDYIIDNPRHLSPNQYTLYVHPTLR